MQLILKYKLTLLGVILGAGLVIGIILILVVNQELVPLLQNLLIVPYILH